MESHLLQMRGLKPMKQGSRMGIFVSHLLQMRGLKPFVTCSATCRNQSHLLQMRGLKQLCHMVCATPS